MSDAFLYVSNWDEWGGTPGIGLYRFHTSTGELTFVSMLDERLSCGVTCIDYSKNIIYFANEVDHNPDFRSAGGGRIYAFRVDTKTGALTELSHVNTLCPNPCHLSFDRTGKYLLAAHHSDSHAITTCELGTDGKYHAQVKYSDSAIVLFNLLENGAIGDIADVVKHTGSGPSPKQKNPHPHSVSMSPSGKLHGVVDKGNDTIRFYEVKDGQLIQTGEIFHLPSPSAPRYLLFHPTARFFYVNHELSYLIRSFSYTEDGTITAISSVDARPTGFMVAPGAGSTESQGFVITANGSHIYTVLHRPSCISVLKTDQMGGIELQQTVPLPTEWPRGCILSRDERFLIVCSLRGGEIEVFHVQPDGSLVPTGFSAKQPAPSALTLFYPNESSPFSTQ